MRIYGERYVRDRRRYDLALRLIAHEARTRTICVWTGLPEKRIRAAITSYGQDTGGTRAARHRGPAPTQPSYFLRTAIAPEAIGVVGLCLITDALPHRRVPNAFKEIPGLHYGEKLSYVCELYARAIPNPRLNLERIMLLTILLAQGDQLQTARCLKCEGLMLIDPLALARRLCVACKAKTPEGVIPEEKADPEPISEQADQIPLF